MKKLYIFTLLFTFCFSVFAQISEKEYTYLKSKIPEEYLKMETNADLFVTGETLNYKTFVFLANNNQLSTISNYAYAALVGSDKTVHFNQKIKVNNGQANGDYFIPSDLVTGNYKLITYTSWSRNNLKNNYCEKDIYIINPFNASNAKGSQNTNEGIVEVNTTDALNTNTTTNTNLLIGLNKTAFKKREKGIITVNNENLNLNNISVSVRKIDSIGIHQNPTDSSIKNTKIDTYFLPELRGQLVSGSIASVDGSSVAHKTVTMSIPGENFILKNAVTNKNGKFFIQLEESYTNTDAIFQMQEENAASYTITIDSSGFPEAILNQLRFKALEMNPSIKNWLKQQSVKNQIENVYYQTKSDSTTTETLASLFYNPYATTYTLDDFNRFRTVKETFIEIIYASSLTESNNKYTFTVHDYDNPNNQYIIHADPLVLVDGILITNNEDIVYYNAHKIEKIAVVVGLYVYGSKVYNGVISFKTKNNDFSIKNISKKGEFIKQITIDQPAESVIAVNPNYEADASKLLRIPDYRTQLLWIPQTAINRGANNFSLFTSDNSGTYQVRIQGYTNAGKHEVSYSYFTVN